MLFFSGAVTGGGSAQVVRTLLDGLAGVPGHRIDPAHWHRRLEQAEPDAGAGRSRLQAAAAALRRQLFPAEPMADTGGEAVKGGDNANQKHKRKWAKLKEEDAGVVRCARLSVMHTLTSPVCFRGPKLGESYLLHVNSSSHPGICTDACCLFSWRQLPSHTSQDQHLLTCE